jgi:hypothetical protein
MVRLLQEASMIAELQSVVLVIDLPEHGLRQGDIGTVVLVHRGGEGYEVEFTTLEGTTLAVVTPLASQVRAIQPGEIAHARTLEAAQRMLGCGARFLLKLRPAGGNKGSARPPWSVGVPAGVRLSAPYNL